LGVAQAGSRLEPAEAVLQFLASVGSNAEAEFYLRLFRARAKESFATIAVEASCLEHDADGVAVDLRFLSELGLTPVVVLGLDLPDAATGHRDSLRELLDDSGVPNEALDIDVPPARVVAATERGAIPLLVARQGDEAARLEQLARLLSALRSHKLIVLDARGALDAHAQRLSVVNLSADYAALMNAGSLDARTLRLVQASRRLVFDLVPHRLLVSVTSPLNLVHELFTVKGAGTLLRKGARVQRHAGWQGVDRDRLRALLEASFGRTANDALFAREIAHGYVADDYRGAALVLATPLGGYLSKFAVTREAQGEGIGQDLWSSLIADYPALLWRARGSNPIRAWYERQCQGRFNAGEWTVYFRGLAPEHVPDAIAFAVAQPIDF
jgi:acetylglutamate kinase